jgi:hypothetical protein
VSCSVDLALMLREHVIEYYDTRAVVRLFDEMHDKPFGSGTLNLRFIWDDTAPPVP